MKRVLVKQLEVGDIFYYQYRYEVVLNMFGYQWGPIVYIKAKCIMSPTPVPGSEIDIGTIHFLAEHHSVLLLCNDGEEV